ncbi:hypothetical protein BKA56DRAFT_594458 [Ilyonectria sp. MPI-CAGE-AT-0026]|nr:hypothetical protein BKA56DRAFT_594458 [Ilyonectria sp. MPI-CAGE-AT-0026]
MDSLVPDPLSKFVDDFAHLATPESQFTPPFRRLYFLASALGVYHDEPSFQCHPLSPGDLHPIQEKSFWILWQWWVDHSAFCRLHPHEDPGNYHVHLIQGSPHILRTDSSHSTHFLNLFAHELMGPWPSYIPEVLKGARGSAVIHSACRAVALPCYRAALASNLGKSLMPLKSDVPIAWPENEAIHGPRILAEEDLPGLNPRCDLGVDVDPCPWLPKTGGLPFFLWDRDSRRTVEVSSLVSRPQYTAISHTWGRWEKVVAGQVKKTNVPGVDAWQVPENTIFDVVSLPTILSKVPATRFVWLDLVCIPQDGSQRARSEIARQAEIFQNSEHSIIWLNRLESWEGLQSAISWMSLVYLGVDRDPFYRTTSQSKSGTWPEGNCTGLFEKYDFGPNIRRSSMTLCGWFTSLWTLQEVCLRPDMWLCNGDWELLTVGAERKPVPINILIALTHACSQVHQERFSMLDSRTDFEGGIFKPSFDTSSTITEPDKMFGTLISHDFFHPGYLELFELLDRTGLDNLQGMQRGIIMGLGSRRYCKMRRAEAIMSVLGVKNWFEDVGTAGGDGNGDLVLGQYPLTFLRETASVIGASFFDSLSFSTAKVADIANGPPPSYRGSLMPFNSSAGDAKLTHPEQEVGPNRLFVDEEDHPSVASWKITQEGSVEISSVGLLASSGDDPITLREGIRCSIWVTHDKDHIFDPEARVPEANARFRSFELHSWLRSYHIQDGPNYAVELFCGRRTKRGVLLKECASSPGTFFKIGNWVTWSRKRLGEENSSKPAEIVAVDWRVL